MAVLKKKKVIQEMRVVKKKAITKKAIVKKSRVKIKTAATEIRRRGKKKSKIVIKNKKSPSIIKKFRGNPIIGPVRNSFWESEAAFNPGAIVHDGEIHLFYRALGRDGISRIGHIVSKDGIHFDGRSPFPVYAAQTKAEAKSHHPYTSPARLVYDPELYPSGGGWGGCEDPRSVKIDGRIYLTFNMFSGWYSMRVAFTSLDEKDLSRRNWNWDKFNYLSRPGDRQKNWVLFPEKINGKFAIFHNLDKGDPSRVAITYMDRLDMSLAPQGSGVDSEAPDPQLLPDHIVAWHNRTRSAGAPPIKTKDGWLLFYHAMDKDDPGRYKVGALLLDLKDPTKVLYRSAYPLVEPDEWYENDYKPGIVYATGAVVKDDTLFLYYGGGDKHIAVATANLDDFLKKLKNKEHAIFSKKTIPVK